MTHKPEGTEAVRPVHLGRDEITPVSVQAGVDYIQIGLEFEECWKAIRCRREQQRNPARDMEQR